MFALCGLCGFRGAGCADILLMGSLAVLGAKQLLLFIFFGVIREQGTILAGSHMCCILPHHDRKYVLLDHRTGDPFWVDISRIFYF